MDLRQFIRDVPDFPKAGILFKDITPLLGDPSAFAATIDQFDERFPAGGHDAIAAVESRGFIFAGPLALRQHKPLVILRKPGKLPYKTHSLAYELEYGSAELQMHVDSLRPGARVLVVDDLLATGGTTGAAVELIRRGGGEVAACAFLVELKFLNGRQKLGGVRVESLLTY